MSQPHKVVAITGASGYIGARLLQELEEHGLGKLVAMEWPRPGLKLHYDA